MNVPVQIFNSNAMDVAVTVNGGTPVTIPASGASLNWVPQQATNAPWSFSPQPPAPDVFGFGPNQVAVQVSSMFISLTAAIPSSSPIMNLQLYVFLAGLTNATWVLLSSGTMIASGTAA